MGSHQLLARAEKWESSSAETDADGEEEDDDDDDDGEEGLEVEE